MLVKLTPGDQFHPPFGAYFIVVSSPYFHISKFFQLIYYYNCLYYYFYRPKLIITKCSLLTKKWGFLKLQLHYKGLTHKICDNEDYPTIVLLCAVSTTKLYPILPENTAASYANFSAVHFTLFASKSCLYYDDEIDSSFRSQMFPSDALQKKASLERESIL
jgi:hypothetical protein